MLAAAPPSGLVAWMLSFPAAPDERLLLPDRLLRCGRDHSTVLEALSRSLRRTDVAFSWYPASPTSISPVSSMRFFDPVVYYYLCLVVVSLSVFSCTGSSTPASA
jgi:hypothetical protein